MLGDFEVNWLVVEPTPLKNMQKSNWIHFPRYIGVKIKKSLKPPTRLYNLQNQTWNLKIGWFGLMFLLFPFGLFPGSMFVFGGGKTLELT